LLRASDRWRRDLGDCRFRRCFPLQEATVLADNFLSGEASEVKESIIGENDRVILLPCIGNDHGHSRPLEGKRRKLLSIEHSLCRCRSRKIAFDVGLHWTGQKFTSTDWLRPNALWKVLFQLIEGSAETNANVMAVRHKAIVVPIEPQVQIRIVFSVKQSPAAVPTYGSMIGTGTQQYAS
jgi:hypothetical protein